MGHPSLVIEGFIKGLFPKLLAGFMQRQRGIVEYSKNSHKGAKVEKGLSAAGQRAE